jgi:succinate dehydrogenase / fumarate reductase cytochrome b subunit
MAASIATRASGVALYGGAIIVVAWAVCLAVGPDCYRECMDLLTSPLGLVVLFGLTVSIFYHMAAGVRHFVWDLGAGMLPRTANALSWASFAFGVAASVALFAGAFLLGGRGQ